MPSGYSRGKTHSQTTWTAMTGEPCNGKLLRTVRRGTDGTGSARIPRQPSTLQHWAFNAVGLSDTQGMPLVEMEQESFALPVMNAIATHFLTATAAARHMRKNGSGVILAITASAVMRYPNVGGFGVASAAIECLCQNRAAGSC